jgi:hypothetical protein
MKRMLALLPGKFGKGGTSLSAHRTGWRETRIGPKAPSLPADP